MFYDQNSRGSLERIQPGRHIPEEIRERLGIQSECNDKKYKYKQRQEHFPIRIFELLYGRIVEILPREKGPHHNGQHVDGSQQSGYQQTGNPEVSHRIATLYGSGSQIPLADKAGQSRYSHQRQCRHGEDAEYAGHPVPHAVQFMYILFLCLVDDGARTEEGADLDHRMEDQMGQRAHQP